MRRLRVKIDGNACYHVMSRCAFQHFAIDDESKTMFIKILRRSEFFSGVHVLNFCVMDNHFHVLVNVPKRKPVSDAELRKKIRVLYGEIKARSIFKRWEELGDKGLDALVSKEQDAFRTRMYDISQFMKTLKQRFSLWYCTNHGNLEGTIWQGRFHSVVVENSANALSAVSAYIDMNPVRAKVVDSPEKYRWSGVGQACAGDQMAKEAIASMFGKVSGKTEDYWRHYRSLLKAKTPVPIQKAPDLRHKPQSANLQNEEGITATRDAKMSRGVAFGSERFVVRITELAASPQTVTFAKGTWEGKGLFAAGRRARREA